MNWFCHGDPGRLASSAFIPHAGTLTEHPITLTQLPYDLHRGVITNVNFVLLAHKGNLGLTKQLDQPAEIRSRHASLVNDLAASLARC